MSQHQTEPSQLFDLKGFEGQVLVKSKIMIVHLHDWQFMEKITIQLEILNSICIIDNSDIEQVSSKLNNLILLFENS